MNTTPKKTVKVFKIYSLSGGLLLISAISSLLGDRIFIYKIIMLLLSLYMLIYGLYMFQKIKDSYIKFTGTGLSFKSRNIEKTFNSLDEISSIEIYDKAAYIYDKYYDKFVIILSDYNHFRPKEINAIKTDLNRLNDDINKEKKSAK